MKKTLFFLVFLFFTISNFAQQYIVDFEVKNRKEVDKLPEYVMVDYVFGNTVTAYLYGDNFDKFKKLGYQYKLKSHPSKGKVLTMATTIDEMANWDRYPTHGVYLQMMNKYANDYPNICKLDTIGYSVKNKPVLVLKITDNPTEEEAEPEFYYTGQMHGDELIAGIIFVRLIDHLLTNYGSDDRVTNLVDNCEIWINPISNPDGVYLPDDNSVEQATRANANGIDLNRNFPSPTKPNPPNVDEPEVQMQLNFSANHHFVMSANAHNGTEIVNYPWDAWASNVKKHADHNWWKHIARNYADEVHTNAPNDYMEGSDNGITHGGDWYVVAGGRQDHMGYYKNCRELTLELSDEKMLSSTLIPAHWNYNRDAMIGYIEECLYGVNGTVTNTSGEPLAAKIFIEGHDKDNSEVFTDPDFGDYYRPLETGTYNITYSADGYVAQTHSVTISEWETTVVKNVVLGEAAQIELSGTVVDATAGSAPLADVEIAFLNTNISPVTTNQNGEYSVTVPENTYQIRVRKSEYATQVQTITVSESNNVLDFAMYPAYTISFEDELPNILSFSETPWLKDNSQAYEGDYCMRSGDIEDSEVSVMSLSATTMSGAISFARKVSSEENYDFLEFYIDGVFTDKWTGELDWARVEYPITEGSHLFEWKYTKDVGSSAGDDCGRVDIIELPPLMQNPYEVTFKVINSNGLPIQNANVYLLGYGTKLTDNMGECVFRHVMAVEDSISYTVSGQNYITTEGKILVVNGDITETVKLIGTNKVTELADGLKIYPNPTTGIVNIQTKQNNSSISVYNINGVEIINKNINLKDKIDLSNYPKGMYLLKIKSDTQNYLHKLILK